MFNHLKKFISSVKYALQGLWFCIRTQQNTRIQIVLLLLICLLSIKLECSLEQIGILLVLISSVIAAEFFNTAIEELCNAFCAEQNRQIKVVKDVAAGAVFFLAIVTLIVSSVIFYHQIKMVYVIN
jgi:diacylglycerol kinase (ATP)